jgi:hypothetical protein
MEPVTMPMEPVTMPMEPVTISQIPEEAADANLATDFADFESVRETPITMPSQVPQASEEVVNIS